MNCYEKEPDLEKRFRIMINMPTKSRKGNVIMVRGKNFDKTSK